MGAKEQISPLELLLKDSHIVDWWLGQNTFLIKVHRTRTLLWDPHGDNEFLAESRVMQPREACFLLNG